MTERLRIVVGVDGSAPAHGALRFALEEGAIRNACVEVIHAWTTPVGALPLGMGALPIDPAEYERAAIDVLDEIVDAELAATREPPPEVRRRVVEGPPAGTLLQASKDAAMLVVGSHGHGELLGLLLGSVSAACVHHARCPVVVVRHEG